MIKVTSFILLLTLGLACTKKTVKIELFEEGCKKIPITETLGSYYESTSICDNDSLTKTVFVTFTTPQPDCIDIIDIKHTDFYRNDGTTVNGFTYTDELKVGGPAVSMTNEHFSYYYCFTPPDQASFDEVGFLIIYYVAKNDLGTESGEKAVRVNLPNFAPHPNNYNVNQTIHVNQEYISIQVWDYAAEDGDYIDLYLNSDQLLENHLLLHEKYTVIGQLGQGTNALVVYAKNEGTSSPNTVAISVGYGDTLKFNPGLLTGEGINIVF